MLRAIHTLFINVAAAIRCRLLTVHMFLCALIHSLSTPHALPCNTQERDGELQKLKSDQGFAQKQAEQKEKDAQVRLSACACGCGACLGMQDLLSFAVSNIGSCTACAGCVG
jgi:hypothetical protein